MPDSPDSTPLQTTHVQKDSQGVEGGEKRRCGALKADGTQCRGYALGDAYGDAAGMCTGHARSAGLLPHQQAREADGQAVGAARRANGTVESPLDALRDILAEEPRRYAAGLALMLEKGDPRVIGLVERLFQVEAEIPRPSTIAALEAMTSEDRRKLLAQLEAERGADPLT